MAALLEIKQKKQKGTKRDNPTKKLRERLSGNV